MWDKVDGVGERLENEFVARLDQGENIVLIGMPGGGKSTVGVLLAKALTRTFIDTDIVIQSTAELRLQDIIDAQGLEAFIAIEERHILSLAYRNAVIATGGSVVYSDKAMAHLKASGIIVHLDLPLAQLKERITNMDSRGIAMNPSQTFEELYEDRIALYRRHAEVTIDCIGRSHEAVLSAVIRGLGLDGGREEP